MAAYKSPRDSIYTAVSAHAGALGMLPVQVAIVTDDVVRHLREDGFDTLGMLKDRPKMPSNDKAYANMRGVWLTADECKAVFNACIVQKAIIEATFTARGELAASRWQGIGRGATRYAVAMEDAERLTQLGALIELFAELGADTPREGVAAE